MTALNQPLGMGCCYAPTKKEWIISALGLAAGLATSLIGGAASARAQRASAERQAQQEAKEDAWYARRYNEEYVDTKAGQNLVRRAKDYAREQWKKAAGAQAVAGGTDAATAQAKEAGNKMVGDTIANIAATDQARKDNIDNMHREAQAKFAQMDMAREQQRAQNISNAAQGASNAIMSAASALDQASSAKPNLAGGDNKSKVTTPSAPSSPSSVGGAGEIIGYNGMGEPIYRNGGVV